MTSINKDDYMEDGQGRLVPLDLVKPIDKTRDGLVRDLVKKAQVLQNGMADFKKTALTEIKSFVDLSAMEWDVVIGGKKGNIILYTFDGRYKAQVQIAENLVFDEQLQIAKKMIDECLTKWTRKSSSEIKVLINDAFQVDKAGRINAKRILSLRRLDIKDKLWCKAMDAISASLQVVNSKEYFRLYKRAGQNKWRPISLDMAAL
ncbi:MAG: DUF3164 family protein [Desulfobacterales bacterium]|nr:DUF3164 family protein [Desulfobacterales bacterium]